MIKAERNFIENAKKEGFEFIGVNLTELPFDHYAHYSFKYAGKFNIADSELAHKLEPHATELLHGLVLALKRRYPNDRQIGNYNLQFIPQVNPDFPRHITIKVIITHPDHPEIRHFTRIGGNPLLLH